MVTLGSQAQLGIGIAIQLHNQFSGPYKQIQSQLQQLKSSGSSAVLGAMKDYRNFSASIAAGSAAATIGMYKMAESGAEFQHRINQIAIVGGRDLGRTRAQLADFAKGLSGAYTRTPTEIAGAMFENIKAGLTKGLDLITKYQIAVATATDETLEGQSGVAFGLISIMNAMDMSYGQFPRIANAVTAAANASQASVSSLNESMQYFANTAHLAGLSLEDTLALISRLSQVGIRGSEAGTALSNMMNYLLKSSGPMATKRSKAAWQMMGFDREKIGDMLNQGKLFQVLEMVDKRAAGMDLVSRKSVLNALFNIRGEKALENLFGSGDPKTSLEGLKKSIKEGVQGDVSMKQSKAMMDDLYGDLGLLKNQFHNFGIAFSEAVAPTLRVLIGAFGRLVGWTTSILRTPVGKILAGIAAVVIPLIGVLFAFRSAMLMATIALNGYARQQALGGFSNILGGGLGMLGNTMGGGAAGAIRFNKLGRAYVAAGETVSFGGKIFKAGQILPKGAVAAGGGMLGKLGSFFGAGAGLSGLGWGAKVIGFLGKMAPWIGKIAGFAFKWLPVIGWIWTIVDLLNEIFGIFKEKPKDPVKDYYRQQLNNETVGKYFPQYQQATPYDAWLAKHGGDKDRVLQTININVDGKQMMSRQIQHDIEDSTNGQLNFNLIH